MPWGFGGYRRYGGYGGYSRGISKTSAASSLSEATLKRILAEKEAEQRASAELSSHYMRMEQERREKAAEEARLEQQHGGKDNLARWRQENAAKVAQEQAKAAAEAKAKAAQLAVVREMADLQVELAYLPASVSRGPDPATLMINKATAKTQFHLSERELEAMPKNVIMKEGAKRPSKIEFSATVIFEAVKAKSGKRVLRGYQAASFPSIARRFVEEELHKLQAEHPKLTERGRAAAVSRLAGEEQKAAQSVEAARAAIAAAEAQLAQAQAKEADVRTALESVATREEIEAADAQKQGAGPSGGSGAAASGSSLLVD